MLCPELYEAAGAAAGTYILFEIKILSKKDDAAFNSSQWTSGIWKLNYVSQGSNENGSGKGNGNGHPFPGGDSIIKSATTHIKNA